MAKYNDAGPFVVTHDGIVRVEGTAIACPECGCGVGLALFAEAAHKPVVAECPKRHTWWVNSISFAHVRDIYRVSQGLPPHGDDVKVNR